MAKPAKVLLNVPAIKADFPILQRTVRDKHSSISIVRPLPRNRSR